MAQVWKWNAKKRDVCAAVFQGDLSHAKIMQKHGVSRGTFDSWLQHAEFKAELQRMRDTLEATLRDQGVLFVEKQQRIVALARMAQSARAEYRKRPLCVERRQIGYDPANNVPVWLENESFNRPAFDAFRGALDDIAKELGARRQNVEHSGAVDLTERVLFVLPTVEE